MRKLNYTIVDVFTDTALQGNPLAVFTQATGLTTEQMQCLARELNLSETVFLQPAEQGGTARARIFTPRHELAFAGHPLVGTAYVIGRSAPLPTVFLETGVGIVPVEIERDGGFVVRCEMAQPEPIFEELPDHGPIAHALGAEPIGPVVAAFNGVRTLLAQVPDVAAVMPDMSAIERLDTTTLGVWSHATADGVRFRVFAPADGVPEDPGTGSAAGPLVEHLRRLGIVGEQRIVISQGVEIGRPSRIEASAAAGRGPRVGGPCVPVARGFFELP